LDILFASGALRRLCHDEAIALRTLDAAVVRHLRARLDDLSAAACLGYAAMLPGRFHALATDGQFAFNLAEGFKLILVPADEPLPRNADGSVNLDKVSAVTVISIGRPHV
jgi:proteic killer suppression protein